MNAREFYMKFVESVKENNHIEEGMLTKFPEIESQKWEYEKVYKENEPAFTELVNKVIIDKIISEIPVDDDLKVHEKYVEGSYPTLTAQHEYFRIDSIGFQHKFWMIDEEGNDGAGILELNRHFWDLKIVVEHENSKRDWMDEVIKLVHIRCPLKVIITYNYCDCRSIEQSDELCDINKLAFIANWMIKVKAFDPDAKEEYLIIIGNGQGKKQKEYDKFDYRGYLYDYESKCFKRI